jgi:antitoxin CcdA
MRMKSTQRKAINLSIDSDLVERARALGLKLSGLAEAAIRKAVHAEEARRWQTENAEAIEAYNRLVAEEGLLSDHVPGWWNDFNGAV